MTGFFAISNEELAEGEPAKPGDLIQCEYPGCDKRHRIEGEDKTPENEDRRCTILTYQCGENTILCGIDGKLIKPF